MEKKVASELAKITHFFVRTDEICVAVQEASFRGYPLHGKEVKLPPGYVGFIASETKKPLSESGQRTATITQKFDSFTYWNWDCTTSNSDPYQKIEDWATLSEVVIELIMFL